MAVGPAITSITPTSGQQGQSLTVTLNGSNLTVAGAPVVTINQAQMLVTVTSATASQIRTTVGIPWSTPPSSYTLTVTFPQIGFLTRSFTVTDRADQPPVISSVSPAKQFSMTPPADAGPVALVAKGHCQKVIITGRNLIGATATFLPEANRSVPSVVESGCSGQVADAINYSDTSLTVYLDTTGTNVAGYYSLAISNNTPPSANNSTALAVEVLPSTTVIDDYAPRFLLRGHGKTILTVCGKNLPVNADANTLEMSVTGGPFLDIQIEQSTSTMLTGTISLRPNLAAFPAGGQGAYLKLNDQVLFIKLVERTEDIPTIVDVGETGYGRGVGINILDLPIEPAAAKMGAWPTVNRARPAVSATATQAAAAQGLTFRTFRYTIIERQVAKLVALPVDEAGRPVGGVLGQVAFNGSRHIGGVVVSAYFRVDIEVSIGIGFGGGGVQGGTTVCVKSAAGAYVSGGPYVLISSEFCNRGTCLLRTEGSSTGDLSEATISVMSGCGSLGPVVPSPASPGVFYGALRNTNGSSGCCQNVARLVWDVASAKVLTLVSFTSSTVDFQSVPYDPPPIEADIQLETYAFNPQITRVEISPDEMDSDEAPATMKVYVKIPPAGSATAGMQNPGLNVTVNAARLVNDPEFPSNPLTQIFINPGNTQTAASQTKFVPEGGGEVEFDFILDPDDVTEEGDVWFEARIENDLIACAIPFVPAQRNNVNRRLRVRRPPARAHIETTRFDPTEVTAGNPSNLIVTVHHGLRMEGMQIPVQVAAQAGSNPCVATMPLERMVQVPATQRKADTIPVTFPFTTTACQVSTQVQVTYRASIPAGRGIIVNLPADDYDTLTVNAPPRLEITSPGRDTTLYIQHRADDGFPIRPRLEPIPELEVEGFSVRVLNVTPDPTATTTFRWKVRVQYDTRQINFRSKEVVWEREAQGGTLPPDILEPCGRMVGETNGDGNNLSCAAGGAILFEVRATINGRELMASIEGPKILAGNNPTRQVIQNWTVAGRIADEANWLKKIAWQESCQIQFATADAPSRYQYRGEPKMNTGGDGGAGIMQITLTTPLPNGPSSAELWDWRANVDAGKGKFDEGKNTATNFPGRVRQHPGFTVTLVNNTNTWRQQNNMQPFTEIRVPAFTRDQLLEDTVRNFNGFGGKTDPLFPEIRDEKGRLVATALPLHEFTLATQNVGSDTNPVYILVVRDLGGGIAEAQWMRVAVSERGSAGDPNYVENVRAQPKPGCNP